MYQEKADNFVAAVEDGVEVVGESDSQSNKEQEGTKIVCIQYLYINLNTNILNFHSINI